MQPSVLFAILIGSVGGLESWIKNPFCEEFSRDGSIFDRITCQCRNERAAFHFQDLI
jgi:hypothetical protein